MLVMMLNHSPFVPPVVSFLMPGSFFAKRLMVVLATLCLVGLSSLAANFTLVPTLVSNDYTGTLVFHMDGLAAGETVEVAQAYDYNGNGSLDGSDVVVRSDLVTDGQANLVGGATNVNVLRDEDGAADGAVSARLHFALGPELTRGVGK